MATLIGLCIRTKLLRSLPPRFKVDIQVGALLRADAADAGMAATSQTPGGGSRLFEPGSAGSCRPTMQHHHQALRMTRACTREPV